MNHNARFNNHNNTTLMIIAASLAVIFAVVIVCIGFACCCCLVLKIKKEKMSAVLTHFESAAVVPIYEEIPNPLHYQPDPDKDADPQVKENMAYGPCTMTCMRIISHVPNE